MYQNHNCYSEVRAKQSSPLNPYPLLSPPNTPQLPVFDHQAWYMRRDQLMPPTIGFKLEILDGPTTTTPYPEMNNIGMGVSDDAYPIKSNNDSSMEMPSSYKSDDTVSDIDDIDSSASCENPSAKSSADSADRDLFTRDVIKVGEARPQPPLRGERVHLTRRGLPYPAEAYAKTNHLPCDHSGGDHCTQSLSHAD
ncbi:unnamed protein product [Hymenolepis diminuta]|uniref:DBR1 domain-containing protein n=1 Tax=Hymenolepis diminuta TaxID=6216 RepID=A0A0R3SPK9_HYMDI|nr:unnamed protein product [Hymenolepis diminuta]